MRSAAAEEAEEVALPVTHLDSRLRGKLGREKNKTKLKEGKEKEFKTKNGKQNKDVDGP